MKKTIATLVVMIAAGGFAAFAQKPSCKELPQNCEQATEVCAATVNQQNSDGTPKKGGFEKGKKHFDKKGGKCHKQRMGEIKCGKKGCCNPALKGITLSDQQKTTLKEQCKSINEKYNAEMKKLKEAKKADIDKQLKKILTADQWKQYEANKAQMKKMAEEQGQNWTQKR